MSRCLEIGRNRTRYKRSNLRRGTQPGGCNAFKSPLIMIAGVLAFTWGFCDDPLLIEEHRHCGKITLRPGFPLGVTVGLSSVSNRLKP